MGEDRVTAKPVTVVSSTAACLSFAGAATFVLLLAMLHLIKPELDPSWHFISEYAIGRYGWIMVLAFLSLALSYVSLFLALRSQLQTITGRTGLALLLVSALGLIIGAVFTTDPITATGDAVTTEGTLHNLGGTVGLAMHAANGAAFGLVFEALRRRTRVEPRRLALGLALAEHMALYPLSWFVDRHHPARGEPGVPALLHNRRAFALATWRHTLFGWVLGRLA